MDDREQAVADAKDMADQLAVFATEHGWKMKGQVKANKKYAFVTLEREYQQEDGDLVQEDLRAFYAIDASADDDQVTFTGPDGVATVLDVDAGDVRTVVTREHPKPRPSEGPVGTIESGLVRVEDENGEVVPPTHAAHQQVHVHVPPTETSVPPIGDTDAAHPTVDAAQSGAETQVPPESIDSGVVSSAHLTFVDPNEIDTAAHQDASHMVPPIPDVYYGGLEPLTPGAGIEPGVPDPTRGQEPTGRTVVEDFHIVPPANEAAVASEALQHAAQAKEHGEDVYSQQDLYGAVRQQQVAPYKNWSPVLSDLTSEGILVKLGVNRKSNNRLDIVWMNSLSNTLDRATVDGAAEKHPPHITPVGFDPQTHGEDLRILHFLEVNGGFRSVAIARIRKIG